MRVQNGRKCRRKTYHGWTYGGGTTTESNLLSNQCMNLYEWGKKKGSICHLYNGIGTLKHILKNCPIALGEGRYRWRYDKVLRIIANVFDLAIRNTKPRPENDKICRSWIKKRPTQGTRSNYLTKSNDWQTSLRCDIIIFSNKENMLIIYKLNIPWEANIWQAHEGKLDEYQELKERCQSKSWKRSFKKESHKRNN